MTEKLKPCLFCGGECDPEGWLAGDGTRWPECSDCGATAPDKMTGRKSFSSLVERMSPEAQARAKAKAEALRAADAATWNRRTTTDK